MKSTFSNLKTEKSCLDLVKGTVPVVSLLPFSSEFPLQCLLLLDGVLEAFFLYKHMELCQKGVREPHCEGKVASLPCSSAAFFFSLLCCTVATGVSSWAHVRRSAPAVPGMQSSNRAASTGPRDDVRVPSKILASKKWGSPTLSTPRPPALDGLSSEGCALAAHQLQPAPPRAAQQKAPLPRAGQPRHLRG